MRIELIEWVPRVFRLLLVCFLSLFYASGVRAAGASAWCDFDDVHSNSVMTADLATANYLDVVGYYEFGWTVSGCTSLPTPVYNREIYVMYWGLGGAVPYCRSTINGIYLDVSPANCATVAPFGSIPTKIYLDKPFPQSGYARKNFVRNEYRLSNPGAYALAPYEKRIWISWARGTTTPGAPYSNALLGVKNGEGTVIITTCTLVNSDILVDFGEVSEAGASERFNIEFSGCTDQTDSKRFNDTVSLNFRSERIRVDGSALQNNVCANCAKGLQIALKDGTGKAIDLSKRYKLSSNGSTTISPKGLKYEFIAELQNNPDETSKGGVIDTQLVFETIVE